MAHEIKQIDQEKNPPTITAQSTASAAWKLDLVNASHETTIAGWVVYCPTAHPFWSYYFVACIHLRNQPGVATAKITRPGATHELLVIAMSPDHVPDLKHPFKTRLEPFNHVIQFTALSRPNPIDMDKVAVAEVEDCVVQILAGTLNPDTDGRSQWLAKFHNR